MTTTLARPPAPQPSALWVSKYLGVPYVDRASSLAGADCWGLYRSILTREAGVTLPDYAFIEPGATLAKARAILGGAASTAWAEIEAGAEGAFDLALMRAVVGVEGEMRSLPLHLGCVIRPGLIIHTERVSGVVVGDFRADRRLAARITGFYRHEAMA